MPAFLGARGLAAKVLWDECPQPVGPFDPRNLFMVFTGHGKAVRTLAIGPAGERLSRIATVQTATTSVAGQGGFGAVMGSKKLKAISVVIGMIPWLRQRNRQGMLPQVNGHAFDLNSVEFWVHLLHDMAYREGIGDALAEGGWRAALGLDLGVEYMRRYYTGWGYAGHWDGHGDLVNVIVYPFWLVGALHWAMDTRDPASNTHGYVQGVERVLPHFEYEENWINPEIGRRMNLDCTRFAPLMDEYYRLRGWDVSTGWPTAERLRALDLEGVHREMVAGAALAMERLPALPPAGPVVDHHRLDEERVEG